MADDIMSDGVPMICKSTAIEIVDVTIGAIFLLKLK